MNDSKTLVEGFQNVSVCFILSMNNSQWEWNVVVISEGSGNAVCFRTRWVQPQASGIRILAHTMGGRSWRSLTGVETILTPIITSWRWLQKAEWVSCRVPLVASSDFGTTIKWQICYKQPQLYGELHTQNKEGGGNVWVKPLFSKILTSSVLNEGRRWVIGNTLDWVFIGIQMYQLSPLCIIALILQCMRWIIYQKAHVSISLLFIMMNWDRSNSPLCWNSPGLNLTRLCLLSHS